MATRTVHNPNHAHHFHAPKPIQFLGLRLKKHHVFIAAVVAVALLVLGDIFKHRIMELFGDALIVPVAERIFQFLGEEG